MRSLSFGYPSWSKIAHPVSAWVLVLEDDADEGMSVVQYRHVGASIFPCAWSFFFICRDEPCGVRFQKRHVG